VLAEQLQACSQQVSALLHTLAEEPGDGEGPSDVAIVLSLPGVGRKMTAWLFAEAAQPLAERDYQMLRTHSGVAPVTKQSGKRRVVVMRRGCNPRLRHALYHMARVAMQSDAHFNSVYAALRAKGQRHGQVLGTCKKIKSHTKPMVLVSYKLLDDYRTLYTINTSFWACSRQTTLPRWDA
jgi:transposase